MVVCKVYRKFMKIIDPKFSTKLVLHESHTCLECLEKLEEKKKEKEKEND